MTAGHASGTRRAGDSSGRGSARRRRWGAGLALVIAVGCSSSGPASKNAGDAGSDDAGTGATGGTQLDGGVGGTGTGGSTTGGTGGATAGAAGESAGAGGSTAGGTGGSAAGGTGGAGGTGSSTTGGTGGSATGGAGGTGGSATGGTGGACPPCAAPPSPDCVGSGPCGCGPYTCPDAGGPTPGPCGGVTCPSGESCCGPPRCGQCVNELSGVFCPDYCDYCQGQYRRYETSSFCTGGLPVLWEVQAITTAFDVPECQDAFTAVPRYCCEETFEPTCP